MAEKYEIQKRQPEPDSVKKKAIMHEVLTKQNSDEK